MKSKSHHFAAEQGAPRDAQKRRALELVRSASLNLHNT